MSISLPKFSSTLSPLPFGLDISDFYIRLMQFKKSSGKIFLKTYHQLELPPEVIQKGEIINSDLLIRSIKKLIHETPGEKIDTSEVVTALPETKTFIKQITTKWPNDADSKDGEEKKKENIIKNIIEKELAEDIPLSLSDLAVDYQIVEGNLKNILPGDRLRIIVGIAPKKVAESYTQVLENSGLIPAALEIEGVAISRALIAAKQPYLACETKIIIDLGATRTGLMIYHDGVTRYSLSIPVSGRKITQNIAEAEKVPFTEAEKIKLNSGLNNQPDQGIINIITPDLEHLVEKIKEAIHFCELRFSVLEKEKTEIILCGGGANWPGLIDLLNQKTGLKVKIGDPWINLPAPPKNFPLEKSLSYTTVIGLALRGTYSNL